MKILFILFLCCVFSVSIFATSSADEALPVFPGAEFVDSEESSSDEVSLEDDLLVFTPDEFESSRVVVESPPVIIDTSSISEQISSLSLTIENSLSSLDYVELLPLLESYNFYVVDKTENFYFLRCNEYYFILSSDSLIPLGSIYD